MRLAKIKGLINRLFYDILYVMGNQRAKAATLHISEGLNPPDERKGGEKMYVTYSDLFQYFMSIIALVEL